MKRILSTALATLAAWSVLAAAAQAQVFARAPVVYRLNEPSGHAAGCVPPCLCPVFFNDDIRGTFGLTLTSVFGTVEQYHVSDVNWKLSEASGDTHITGSGKYTRIAGFAGILHQLTLELSFNGGTPRKFDSGLQNEGTASLTASSPSGFPDIVLAIAEDVGCFHTSIAVDASPVPSAELTRYRLTSPSSFQQGCFPPCLCPLQAPVKMRGVYDLVLLRDLGTIQEYAVVNARFRTVGASLSQVHTVRGAGFYTRISGFAGYLEQFELGATVDGGPLTAFDSGLNNGGDEFPDISATLTDNDFVCFNTVLDLFSSPVGASLTPFTLK